MLFNMATGITMRRVITQKINILGTGKDFGKFGKIKKLLENGIENLS